MVRKIELTQQEVDEKQQELEKIEEQLSETLKQQRIAKEFGDLSENTEYEVATKEAKNLQRKREELLDQLENYVIIEPDNYPQITIGCTVAITRLDSNNNKIGVERVLRLASEGNSTEKQTLGINSPLGKAILNGTDGIYTIQTVIGGVKYYVRKETAETNL